MFRFLYELIVGQATQVKDVTIGYVQYFGLLFVMTAIYMVLPCGPLILWAAMNGKFLTGVVCCLIPALALAGGSIDIWMKKLQEEVRNETLRGKPLDDTLEGE